MNPDRRAWEDYTEYRDKLAALDTLPHCSAADKEASRLVELMRPIEVDYDRDDLEARYDDPEKAENKARQITIYAKMYRTQFDLLDKE